MIIGKVGRDDKKVRFRLDLRCTCCQKRVPGGMATSERYFGTYSFLLEVDCLKKTYLCGSCRDSRRTGD